MKIAKRQKIFAIVFCLVICISLLYVIFKTYVDPGLPFGVNDDRFSDYLNEGAYNDAKAYWDQMLAAHPKEDESAQITARFNGILSEHLRYMDVYCADPGFSPDGFYARYGNIGAMENYVKEKLLICASKTVTRYANLNISYTHARTVIELLCGMLGDTASQTAMLTALDAYRDVIAQYEKADEQMQMQNYIGAIRVLSVIHNNLEEDLYLQYLASCDLSTAIEAVKVEADEYAVDRDYKASYTLLSELCELTDDEEAHKMKKRVHNIMYPGY